MPDQGFQGPNITISASGVSDQLVRQFLEDYLDNREGLASVEKVFRHFGRFRQLGETRDASAFGFNEVFDKAVFVEGAQPFPLSGWSFAVAEERRLSQMLEDKLRGAVEATHQIATEPVLLSPAAILSAADQLARRTGHEDLRARLVVLATRLETDFAVELLKLMETPRWSLPEAVRANRVFGKYRGRLFLNIPESAVDRMYSVDMERFGVLTQLNPPVELTVADEGNGLASSRVDSALVRVRLYQSYEIEVTDPHAVWAVPISTNVRNGTDPGV
jgi:hypothetical protein